MPLIRKDKSPAPASPVDAAKVLTALASGTEDDRWQAARAAPGIPGVAKALSDALMREPSARVREAMFTSLSRIVTPESVEVLLPLLRLDDARLRVGALDALRAMKGVAWAYLPVLLRDADPDVRLLACELARDQPGEDAARLLCEMLDSEHEANVCASAVEVLAEIGGPDALPALARCGERFRGNSFLEFAISATVDRIRSPSAPPRD
jgi:HEAT repeat protein